MIQYLKILLGQLLVLVEYALGLLVAEVRRDGPQVRIQHHVHGVERGVGLRRRAARRGAAAVACNNTIIVSIL